MGNTDWKPIRSLDGLSLAGIYALRHKASGRVMVCGSTNVYKRLWDDMKALEHGKHYNAGVQRDLDADGPNAFQWCLVQKVGVPALLKLLKAYHIAEMERQGLSYNVKPAVPKRPRRARKADAPAPVPEPPPPSPPSPPRPTTTTTTTETWKAKEKRMAKALYDGLPAFGNDGGASRVNELLRRVQRLRNSDWGVP